MSSHALKQSFIKSSYGWGALDKIFWYVLWICSNNHFKTNFHWHFWEVKCWKSPAFPTSLVLLWKKPMLEWKHISYQTSKSSSDNLGSSLLLEMVIHSFKKTPLKQKKGIPQGKYCMSVRGNLQQWLLYFGKMFTGGSLSRKVTSSVFLTKDSTCLEINDLLAHILYFFLKMGILSSFFSCWNWPFQPAYILQLGFTFFPWLCKNRVTT